MCFCILAAMFAVQNGSERVQLQLGILTLRSVSLPAVVFGSMALGMLMVFLAGLRADLRTRRMLRRYQEALGGSTPEEP
jgi:uncharacterized integral membrane protein